MVVGCWVGLAFENGMVLKWLVGGLMLVVCGLVYWLDYWWLV